LKEGGKGRMPMIRTKLGSIHQEKKKKRRNRFHFNYAFVQGGKERKERRVTVTPLPPVYVQKITDEREQTARARKKKEGRGWVCIFSRKEKKRSPSMAVVTKKCTEGGEPKKKKEKLAARSLRKKKKGGDKGAEPMAGVYLRERKQKSARCREKEEKGERS